MAKDQSTKLRKQIREIVYMLLAVFVFGVFITTIASFDGEGTPPVPHMIGLGVHVLIALGLFVNGARVYLSCKKAGDTNVTKLVLYGFLSICGAILSGILTIATPLHEAGAFTMAMFYMFAVSVYGIWLFKLTPATKLDK